MIDTALYKAPDSGNPKRTPDKAAKEKSTKGRFI